MSHTGTSSCFFQTDFFHSLVYKAIVQGVAPELLKRAQFLVVCVLPARASV